VRTICYVYLEGTQFMTRPVFTDVFLGHLQYFRKMVTIPPHSLSINLSYQNSYSTLPIFNLLSLNQASGNKGRKELNCITISWTRYVLHITL
jgi:hypothetical protein